MTDEHHTAELISPIRTGISVVGRKPIVIYGQAGKSIRFFAASINKNIILTDEGWQEENFDRKDEDRFDISSGYTHYSRNVKNLDEMKKQEYLEAEASLENQVNAYQQAEEKAKAGNPDYIQKPFVAKTPIVISHRHAAAILQEKAVQEELKLKQKLANADKDKHSTLTARMNKIVQERQNMIPVKAPAPQTASESFDEVATTKTHARISNAPKEQTFSTTMVEDITAQQEEYVKEAPLFSIEGIRKFFSNWGSNDKQNNNKLEM